MTNNHQENIIRIGWIGSEETKTALTEIQSALKTILANYPQVKLCFVGCTHHEMYRELPPERCVFKTATSKLEMIEMLKSFDIGLDPSPLDVEAEPLVGVLKSALYMQHGIPPVALDVPECSDLIQDGITGMLVRAQWEWKIKTEYLIRHPAQRKEIAENARKLTLQYH